MIWQILLIFIILYVLLGVYVYLRQDKMVFKPTSIMPETPESRGLEFEDVYFESSNGKKLNGWYVPVEGSKETILFCHGNKGNVSDRLDTIKIYNDLGCSLFIFDYQGYGKSEGEPSEEGTYEDSKAAIKWLENKSGLKSEEIILHGRSLGGAIATRLALEVKFKKFILESAFTSIKAMGAFRYPILPIRWLSKINFPNIDRIKDIHLPLLVVHSREDEVIPFEFGEQLFSSANEPKKFAEIKGEHGYGFLHSGIMYTDPIKRFLEL